MTQSCVFLNISRQAYYKQCRCALEKEQRNEEIIRFIRAKRMQHPRMGGRKLLYFMKQNKTLSNAIGRDKLFQLMREARLLVPCRRAYHKTTQSNHRFWCHPNLIKASKDQVVVNKPKQVWVADITYLPVREGQAYLSLITDMFSRKIVGHYVHSSLKTCDVVIALKKAIKCAGDVRGLVHHSDRGIQYCSAMYQAIHHKYGIRCSMTDGYDCYQNALAERVNGILKNEYLLEKPMNLQEAKKMVKESITLYNESRPHLSLKYKTPDEVHRAF